MFGHKEITKAELENLELRNVESNIQIIGVSGVEDLLQEDLYDCI